LGQSTDEVVISTVDVMDVVDSRLTHGNETGNDERGTGANVRCTHLSTDE
jgi:hypothetical protein